MSAESLNLFWSFSIFAGVVAVIGFYCVLATYNLIRALIGLEILVKAATLFIIVAGYVSGHVALAQSLAITLIVIEVVVMTVAVGIVFGAREFDQTLDVRKLRNLKG